LELRRVDGEALIKKEDLDKNQYFISIIDRSSQSGLIGRPETDNIQAGISALLQKLILKYTGGDSSSVKIETAVNILYSVYYILDAYAAGLDRPGDMITALHEKSMAEIYNEGVEIVAACVEETKNLYKEISETKLEIPLEIYNDTINIAMPEFFRTYDIEFAAHDITASMDYPLAFDDMTIRGIFYIRQYLEKLQLETRFCSAFSLKSILELLQDYGRKFSIDITYTPFNLFETLFDQSVFSVLSGSGIGEITVYRQKFEHLNQVLYGKSHKNIQSLIDDAVNRVADKFDITDTKMIDYMNRYKTQFAKRFIIAFKNGNLSNMVIIDGENSDDGKIVFKDGERISDENFAGLVDLVQICQSTGEKIKMITANVHSIADYKDILEQDCLYGDEFTAAFEVLSDIALVVLGYTIFEEELISGPFHLSQASIAECGRNVQSQWQTYYLDFLCRQSEDRREQIEDILNKIIIPAEDSLE
jgi:hypothetical protein